MKLNDWIWPQAFCGDFIDNYWERDPCVFQNPGSSPIGDLAELFAAVIGKQEFGASDRFWVTNQQTPRAISDFRQLDHSLAKNFGVRASDKTLENFFARMAGKSFGINIHDLGQGDEAIDARLQALATAFQTVGLPPKPQINVWRTDTFFGNYRATPFGIHIDPASVFAFSLLGHRTYYSWDKAYFSHDHPDLYKPDLELVEKHIEHAQVFHLSPGEVFYWPSNRWHVATSNGEPSAVVQLSAYLSEP